MNTRIPFMYRDAGNNKQHGDVIVAGRISLAQLAQLTATLDEGCYFGPVDVNIDPLWPTDSFHEDLDHNSHEVDVIELRDYTVRCTTCDEPIICDVDQRHVNGENLWVNAATGSFGCGEPNEDGTEDFHVAPFVGDVEGDLADLDGDTPLMEVSVTTATPTDGRTIDELLAAFQRASEQGWPSLAEDPEVYRDVELLSADHIVNEVAAVTGHTVEALKELFTSEFVSSGTVEDERGELVDGYRPDLMDDLRIIAQGMPLPPVEYTLSLSVPVDEDGSDGAVEMAVDEAARLLDRYDVRGRCRITVDTFDFGADVTVTVQFDGSDPDLALDLVNDGVAALSQLPFGPDVEVDGPNAPVDRLADPTVRKRAICAVARTAGVGKRAAANLLDGTQAPKNADVAGRVDAVRDAYRNGVAHDAVSALFSRDVDATFTQDEATVDGATVAYRNAAEAVAQSPTGKTVHVPTGLPRVCNDPLSVAESLDAVRAAAAGSGDPVTIAVGMDAFNSWMAPLVNAEFAHTNVAVRQGDLPANAKVTLGSVLNSFMQMNDDHRDRLTNGRGDEAEQLLRDLIAAEGAHTQLFNDVA